LSHEREKGLVQKGNAKSFITLANYELIKGVSDTTNSLYFDIFSSVKKNASYLGGCGFLGERILFFYVRKI